MTEEFLVYYGFPIIGLIITLFAQFYVNNSYSKYKKHKIVNKQTGAETARMILDVNGLNNIKVTEVRGNLTDHYDPRKKVVSLSSDIYHGTSIASVSVAAHECGHAIQDKENYLFLTVRNKMVPIVNFSSKISYLVIIIGIAFSAEEIAVFGLLLLLAMLLFQLITLPVEFNASKRAKTQLSSLNVVNDQELKGTKTMLNAAALTYVAAFITTLLQILRIAFRILNNRKN